MAARSESRRRHGVGATVILQARVAPDTRDRAHRAAAALGVSMAAYIEQLLLRDELDDTGRPVWAEEEPLERGDVLPGMDRLSA